MNAAAVLATDLDAPAVAASGAEFFSHTAAGAGLYACQACDLVSRPPGGAAEPLCPRCGAHLHWRKPESVGRSWAWLLAAAALYFPANLLPIMETNSLFNSQRDTILSGVFYLWRTGSWGTGTVVFFASILEPLLKIVAMAALLVSVQRKSAWRPRTRARIFRIVTIVGRWSMLDIYVLTLLVALVQVQTLAEVTAGPGAFAFGAVVVLTMLSAHSFDPRLIWDRIPHTAAGAADADAAPAVRAP